MPFMENRSFAVPTRAYAYAPSEAPVRFSKNWRGLFKKKPTSIWSVPGSEADCPYDVDDLAFGEQGHERTEGDHGDHTEQAEQDDIPMETHSVNQYDAGSAYNDIPAAPADSLEGFLETLRADVEWCMKQLENQNGYNKKMHQNMQTVAREFGRLSTLEETVDAMRAELNSLSRSRNGTAGRQNAGVTRRDER